MAGPPVHVRVDAAPLDHQWYDAAPALGVLADGFSARFEGEFEFETARYRFDLRVDDGIRLYIDDEKVLDAWQGQVADFAPEVDLTAGLHRVRVEYYEGAGNAQLALNWRRTDGRHGFARAATLFTHLYALDAEKATLQDFAAGGGAVESVGDRLLVATTHGRLALIHPNGQVEYLAARIPMNLAGLEAHPTGRTPPVMTRFRVTDILLQAHTANRYELFAAHHYFAGNCIRLRLSAATLVQQDERLAIQPDWRTVFEAEPCLTFRNDGAWKGHEAGGKMVANGPHHLLLIIGDHGRYVRDGTFQPDEPASHLGRLLRIEHATGAAQVLTRGHRNPQGLARDADGRLWAPEHGPNGGDELNLLLPGRHYGWPLVTYGKADDGNVFGWLADGQETGQHAGFTRPIFAWVPSIAPSSLVVNDPRAFPLWRDDLLLASLKTKSLFRIRRQGLQVQYVERMEIGQRVRDLTHMPDGRLAVLLDDDHQVLFLKPSAAFCDAASRRRRNVYALPCPADADAGTSPVEAALPTPEPAAAADARVTASPGARLFSLRCGNCHNLQVAEHGAGPHLVGIVGRRAGAVADYQFSGAFQALNQVWTRDSLERFLAAPARFVPGTSMTDADVTATDARAIVDFLYAAAE